MVRRVLYVEGGGDKNPSLASECRKAFSKLFERAGVTQKPRVVACGGRGPAYEAFRSAQEQRDTEAWLLVDAEDLPTSASPWSHVKARAGDAWERPADATDDQLHLMTATMEAWLAADPDALSEVMGRDFDTSKLPAVERLESTPKQALYDAFDAAAKRTKAGKYEKGSHSFKALEGVCPTKLRRLTWGQRFLDAMGAIQ
jgi:hypothetical protein